MNNETKKELEEIGKEALTETIKQFSVSKNIKKSLSAGAITGVGAGVSILSNQMGLDIEQNLIASVSTMVVMGVVKSVGNWWKNR